MKLVIGNKNYSSWSLRAWILMRYYEIEFEEHNIALFTDDMHEKMTDVCPNFKVPVLIVNTVKPNETKIWDSLAICEYINEQYLNGYGWPKNRNDRAIARSVCAEMHTSFLSLRHELPMNCRRPIAPILMSEDAKKDITRIITLWQEILHAIDNKNTTDNDKSSFLFGGFSIADAFYMPVVSRFNSYQIEVPNRIKEYMDLMLALPAYQQWKQAAEQEIEVIDCEEK